MKRLMVVFIYSLILNLFCFSNEDFIKIKARAVIIGNDSFNIYLKSFTGVSGETNLEGIKYYLKEHTVHLDSYEIRNYLITNEDFYKFRNDTGYIPLYGLEKKIGGDSVYNGFIQQDYPVYKITLLDAIAYCQWFSDRNDVICRLPTNAEWECAALLGEKKLFPWGNNNKVLKETGIDEKSERNNYSVYSVTEDTSKIGMHNLMGGTEYTLDCYDERFYENSPIENPVCLIPYNAQTVMRGIPYFNQIAETDFGLYKLSWNSISDWAGYSYFRTVISDNIEFNKDTEDACLYYLNIGKKKENTVRLYSHPNSKSEYEEFDVISNFYIVFKTIDNNFFRVFFRTNEVNLLGNNEVVWKIGWVSKDSLVLQNKKWYDTNIYRE